MLSNIQLGVLFLPKSEQRSIWKESVSCRRIEDETFHDFHIHFATERYQEFGTREDAYAEPTDRYGDFDGAFLCLRDDANLEIPDEPQYGLFEEG